MYFIRTSKIIPFFFLSLFLFLSIVSFDGIIRADELTCHICDGTIEGTYWTLDGNIYCEDCFNQYGPRCDLCGNLLTGKYGIVPFSGNKFCKDCLNNYPPCFNCRNPVGPQGVVLDSKRSLCPVCYSRAIFTHGELAPVYQEAVRQVEGLGLKLSEPVVNLSIMDKDELDIYLGVSGIDESGFCESWTTEGEIYAHRIYVLDGLSYEEALSVLCHELAHAWHGENNPHLTSLFLCEGFAEWVAYKIMINKGFLNYAERMYNNPDPVYGEGLRYMLELETKYGTSRTINYIKTVIY